MEINKTRGTNRKKKRNFFVYTESGILTCSAMKGEKEKVRQRARVFFFGSAWDPRERKKSTSYQFKLINYKSPSFHLFYLLSYTNTLGFDNIYGIYFYSLVYLDKTLYT